MIVGSYGVVPVAVEVVTVEVDFGELGVADFDALGIVGLVQAGVDLQADAGGGAGDALVPRVRQTTVPPDRRASSVGHGV